MARVQPNAEGKRGRLSPEQLGLLAKQLAGAPNPIQAARIRERLTRGLYGIEAQAGVQRYAPERRREGI